MTAMAKTNCRKRRTRLGIVRREDGVSIVELFEGVLWVEGMREGLEGVLMGGVAFGGRGFVWLLGCLFA